MKTILFINDGSTAASSAAKLMFQIARDVQAEVLIVQTNYQATTVPVKVLAGGHGATTGGKRESEQIYRLLQRLNEGQAGFQPSISQIELPLANAADVAAVALRANCWMIVSGYSKTSADQQSLNFQSLLNRLQCPLLLVPDCWEGESIRRITYMADLRYCRLNIMRYLTGWALASRASLSLAHFSKEGLAPIVESYGVQLFGEIAKQLPPCSLTFNNIPERDIHRALDVLVNGLHADLMVLVNHRFHFEQIMGGRLNGRIPEGLAVPVLLFPM
ncbi:hypothetical protein [Mucilaginibacter sp. AK015]|uniref:hypothetical protein n=1 Tax=Mucilaginibacter sp. AK015 TaxID=2723072 RepID=UPI00160D6944|nr:hypothetical protein [Mucilaginibacter sp. AK015]MBB5396861.1 hypothetical protein [Mucilaginibacter sp. AK015]